MPPHVTLAGLRSHDILAERKLGYRPIRSDEAASYRKQCGMVGSSGQYLWDVEENNEKRYFCVDPVLLAKIVPWITPSNIATSKYLKVPLIGDSKKNIWINLGAQFALRINKSSLGDFKKIMLKDLLTKKITARGYLVYYPNRKQFRMLVRHPIALTIVK